MSNFTFDYDSARTRVLEAMFRPTFSFMVKTLSAYDAWAFIEDAKGNDPTREFQLAKAYGDVHNEIDFHLDMAEPGDPVSPVIEGVELSSSNFYITIRFKDTPLYMTVPATATITIGWLEKNHD